MTTGWSLESIKWHQLLSFATTHRIQWQRCLFKQQCRDLVPEAPGVYVIEIPSPLQTVTPEHLREKIVMPMRSAAYVGESATSIRSRFISHTSPAAQERIRQVHTLPMPDSLPRWFVWTVMRDYASVQVLESLMIDCFRPPCNKIGGVRLGDGVPAGSPKLD